MEQVIFKYLRAEPEDHYFLMVSGRQSGRSASLRIPHCWDFTLRARSSGRFAFLPQPFV